MKENKLVDLSMDFAISIVTHVKSIRNAQKESVLTNQLLRSGTSIGANIREANYGQSRADFIAKLQISLKECYESEYWIELLFKTGYLSEPAYTELTQKSGTIRRILIASLQTAKDPS